MKKTAILLLLLSGMLHAQDMVKLTNGAELNVKITNNNPETISFSRNSEDLQYFISKGEIDEIRFENGTIEKFEHPVLPLETAKQQVVDNINNEAVSRDGLLKMQATFENRNLRLVELDSKNKPTNKGVLLDMMKIIRFDETSYRREGFAFVNIWVMMQEDEKKNEWVKYKLVIRTNTHESGAILTNSLHQLNKSLKANR